MRTFKGYFREDAIERFISQYKCRNLGRNKTFRIKHFNKEKKMKTYKGILNKQIVGNGILCFGSNGQGKHGKGTAKLAMLEFGAIYGQPKGLQGRSYAIVTKDLTKSKHPSVDRDYIIEQINNLYLFAIERPEWNFYVPYTGIGENLNAYTPLQMAEMFAATKSDIPVNMVFEETFAQLIKSIKSNTLF